MSSAASLYCPRGTLRSTTALRDSGRCGCAPCRLYKAARRGSGQRKFDVSVFRRKKIFQHALDRAKSGNLPFDLTLADIVIPEFCPVLGLKLEHGVGKTIAASPTLDRKIPSLGYVKGNVAVISSRANTIKSDATAAEILQVAKWILES